MSEEKEVQGRSRDIPDLWANYVAEVLNVKEKVSLFLKDQDLDVVNEGIELLKSVIEHTKELEAFFRGNRSFTHSGDRTALLLKYGNLYHSLTRLGFFGHQKKDKTIEDSVSRAISALIVLVSYCLAVPMEG